MVKGIWFKSIILHISNVDVFNLAVVLGLFWFRNTFRSPKQAYFTI